MVNTYLSFSKVAISPGPMFIMYFLPRAHKAPNPRASVIEARLPDMFPFSETEVVDSADEGGNRR